MQQTALSFQKEGHRIVKGLGLSGVYRLGGHRTLHVVEPAPTTALGLVALAAGFATFLGFIFGL